MDHTDSILIALKDMDGELSDIRTIAIDLQARTIPDLDGVSRRLDEVSDAVERLALPARVAPLRPWWLTPSYVTLALVAGVLVALALVRYRVIHVGVSVLPAPLTAPAVPGKKGRT